MAFVTQDIQPASLTALGWPSGSETCHSQHIILKFLKSNLHWNRWAHRRTQIENTQRLAIICLADMGIEATTARTFTTVTWWWRLTPRPQRVILSTIFKQAAIHYSLKHTDFYKKSDENCIKLSWNYIFVH